MPFIILLGLVLMVTPALMAQETEEDEPQGGSFWESIKAAGQDVLEGAEDAVAEAGEVLSHTGEQAAERAKLVLKETREKYFPIIEEAGYEVDEIHLTFSLAPGIELKITRVEKIGAEKQEALLAKYHGDSGASSLLEAMFMAEGVEVEGFELQGLMIAMGLYPRATVILTPS